MRCLLQGILDPLLVFFLLRWEHALWISCQGQTMYVLTCDTISWYLWHFKQVFHRGCKLSGGTVTIETTLWQFFCSVDSPFKKVVASTSQLFLYISQPPANAFHCFKKWKTSGFIFKPSYPQMKPGLKGISLENMNGKLQNTKPPFILVHGMYFVQNIGTCCT